MTIIETRKNLSRRQLLATGALALTAGRSNPSFAEENELADYHMPLETARHDRTIMQWPVSVDVYGEALLKRVQSSIADIANAISKYEEVVVLVGPDHAGQANAMLGSNIQTWDIPTDDLWCRDSGPTFVKDSNGLLAISHIQFNGWGKKQIHDNDAQIAKRVAEKLGMKLLETELYGEQGGLEHDGNGLVLAHSSSWVNENRNSGNADEIGAKLLAAVGGSKMLWAPGIAGADITDYHIDALARFVSPGKILIQLPAQIDANDPWSKSAFETLSILKSSTTTEGKPLDIVVIPEPVNIRSRKQDFVASYVNYYVCNEAVICSEFGDKQADGHAKEIMQELYPNREIVSFNTDPIGESGGGIHCSTQQQPAAGV